MKQLSMVICKWITENARAYDHRSNKKEGWKIIYFEARNKNVSRGKMK